MNNNFSNQNVPYTGTGFTQQDPERAQRIEQKKQARKKLKLLLIGAWSLVGVMAVCLIITIINNEALFHRIVGVEETIIEEKVEKVMMYLPDGTAEQVLERNVDAYIDDGWYMEPVMYVYHPDASIGRVVCKRSERDDMLGKGYYDTPHVYVKLVREDGSKIYKIVREDTKQTMINIGYEEARYFSDLKGYTLE